MGGLYQHFVELSLHLQMDDHRVHLPADRDKDQQQESG